MILPIAQATLLIPKKWKQAKQASKAEGLGELKCILYNVQNPPKIIFKFFAGRFNEAAVGLSSTVRGAARGLVCL